jgi:hypothetical protein
MSHKTGKIEVSSMTKENIIFRYHRAVDEENYRKFFVYKRNPNAYWYDDYTDLKEIYKF